MENLSINQLSDLQEVFVKRIEGMMDGYNESRVVFDRYLDKSLKNKRRQKRAMTSTEFEIHPEMKLTMSLKEIPSASRTKSTLTSMFAQGLQKRLEQFVCRVFCSTGPTTLQMLRWELFRSKNLEGEMLPPTSAALLPHITQANYMTMRDKSYPMNCPTLHHNLLLNLRSPRDYVGSSVRSRLWYMC